jgi:hypothetical protein
VIEIKVGDTVRIPADGRLHPERGHSGKCVFVSEDGKTVAIECERSHEGKRTVFIVQINSEK